MWIILTVLTLLWGTPVYAETTGARDPMATLTDDAKTEALQNWLSQFRRRATAARISSATLDVALPSIRYDPDVVARDRNQAEFTKSIWDYLDSAVSARRISDGRRALRTHRKTLSQIEAAYGVPAEIVTAIWGLESAYGSFRGDHPTLQSLATLAYDGRRAAFFEGELIAALRILDSGDVRPADMRGSWAGAMGHTQFMPSSFLARAVDFDADGKRDIWADDPTDALASTARYLQSFGWTTDQPWGLEVQVPEGFDYTLARRDIRKTLSEWAALGVKPVTGTAPADARASLLLPAGHKGVALVVFNNFKVLEAYNRADAYVIGVGHLSDRISGSRAFQASWPKGDAALSREQMRELQTLLKASGFHTQQIDGLHGPQTMKSIRSYQAQAGLVPDGYASMHLLRRLRGE